MALLDYLTALGVNAVELLPVSEFSGNLAWGYGDTHHFVIESSAGGRDKYKHFVRECHRRGIAVIQDVVYNHYDSQAERAQWQYDSTAPEQNIYYWYEGIQAPTGAT
jgi:1,4-alpha-glucan branching enzyme